MMPDVHGASAVRNRILNGLALADLYSLRPHLQPVSLKERAVLQEPRTPIEHVYFIETGLVSLRTSTAGNVIETAMVGCHGAVGALVALGAEAPIHHSSVLVAGRALRIAAGDLHRLMVERPSVRDRLLKYVQALMVHGSQTALCAACHELEPRLACWLSIACDALDGDVLPVTHDHLSVILKLRRAGLTEALIRFEEEGLIHKSRGVIHVLERPVLRDRACGCYRIVSHAYGIGRSHHVAHARDGDRLAPSETRLS